MYSVYAIRCKENGKIYIGCTKDPSERIRQHFRELEKHEKTVRSCGTRGPSDWQKDYDKYGKDAFECYLIEDDISDSAHRDREQFWIDEYQSWNSEYGYNIRRSVNGPAVRTTLIHCLPPKPFE